MQAATVRTHLSSADAHTMPPLNHSPVEADTNVGLIFFNGVMGSGKTKTLIERCARNVRQGVKTAVHVPCFLAGRRKVESRNGTTVDCNVLPHQAKLDEMTCLMYRMPMLQSLQVRAMIILLLMVRVSAQVLSTVVMALIH